MKLVVCAVYDSATAQYGNPFFVVHRGQAVRMLTSEVNRQDVENLMNKYPKDYLLFDLGTFDTDSGLFDTRQPEQIARCEDLKS